MMYHRNAVQNAMVETLTGICSHFGTSGGKECVKERCRERMRVQCAEGYIPLVKLRALVSVLW